LDNRFLLLLEALS